MRFQGRTSPVDFRALLNTLLAACLCAAAGFAAAQSWPARPVKIVVSQPPGTGPDIIVRMFSDFFSKEWGQAVIVENRAGGASVIGAQAVQRAAADGYTFLFTTPGILWNSFLFKSLPYDVERDFTPVSLIGRAPFVLAVTPDLPVKNVGELIALLKSQPGKLSLASDGPKGLSGLMGEMFKAVTGTNYVHVPYNGTAPAIQDTIVGRTQFTFQSAPAMMSFIKSGKIRPIAVVGTRRIPWAENLPLVKDNIPDFEYMGGYMMYAPAGTPPEIVQRVNRDAERGLKAPLIAQRLFDLGPVTDGGGPPQVLLDYQRAELKRWERLSKAINLQPE